MFAGLLVKDALEEYKKDNPQIDLKRLKKVMNGIQSRAQGVVIDYSKDEEI